MQLLHSTAADALQLAILQDDSGTVLGGHKVVVAALTLAFADALAESTPGTSPGTLQLARALWRIYMSQSELVRQDTLSTRLASALQPAVACMQVQ